MAMRGAVRRERAGKEFLRNLIGVLIAYAPIAAILTLAAGTPLGGVLIFGVIIVPVTAAILTVVVIWVGGDGEVRVGADGRSWGESGHHPGHTHPAFFAGDDRGHSGWDGGGGDGGGGGGDA